MRRLFCCLLLVAFGFCTPGAFASLLVITAEGLVDPDLQVYQADPQRVLEDLRRDARSQIVEKAITTLVEGASVRKYYALLQDGILNNAERLIRRVVREGEPTKGRDGFMHLIMQAEVDLSEIRDNLGALSREERVDLIRAHGDPAISTAVIIKDAEVRGAPEGVRSQIAENILKESLSRFGYRVWSEKGDSSNSRRRGREVDFAISSEANFKYVQLRLAASGLEVRKYLLTSWTVKCTDRRSGEEIYFNSQIPQRRSWPSKEAALRDIGRLIASEFSEDFFRDRLAAPTRLFELDVEGLAEYDLGVQLERELIGLRSVVNAEFRGFDADGLSLYEVEFSGSARDFPRFFNNDVLKPLNAKLGERAFRLATVGSSVLRVRFRSDVETDELIRKLETLPPTSLAEAPPERIRQVVRNSATMRRVAVINPVSVAALAKEGDSDAEDALQALEEQEGS